jgi:hypothetical protein
MDQKKRILIAVVILLVVVGVVLGVDYWQRQKAASQMPEDMPPGSIPIVMDGKFVKSFVPEDLSQMETASFVDDEEGKTQEGWLLKDVLALYVDIGDLKADSEITVSSSSREKAQTLSWEQVENVDNMVLFDLSGRGTLKLVSKIPGFDIRDAWVQDVDKIEIANP